MKPKIHFLWLFLQTGTYVHGQSPGAKERAINLATNDFSKTKAMRLEKHGIVKETYKVVKSIPVVESNLQFYTGNYWYEYLKYKLEIRMDEQKKIMVTLSTPDKPDVRLKNVTVADAYFVGFKPNEDGTEEKWEGAFIKKIDAGNSTFGLGIKLPVSIPLTHVVQTTKLFFEKASP